MNHNKSTGKEGEDLAAAYLQQLGYLLLERNWRFKHWEVDIIACKGTRLHIVEIKTRRNEKFGKPEESIGAGKMRSLKNAAEAYQYLNPGWKLLQFDVLSILLRYNQPAEYFLIEDVYF